MNQSNTGNRPNPNNPNEGNNNPNSPNRDKDRDEERMENERREDRQAPWNKDDVTSGNVAPNPDMENVDDENWDQTRINRSDMDVEAPQNQNPDEPRR